MKRFILAAALSGLSALSGCALTPPATHFDQPRDGVNFWVGDIGPSGPRFSGPQQYPFICMTFNEGLGQPLIDNHDGIGNAVFRETLFGPWIYGKPLGYSQHCSIATRIDYYYFSAKQNEFVALADRTRVPNDVARIEVNGREVDFIVRAERGTLNRFLYSIAMLAPFEESLATPKALDNSAWNGDLIYKFQGGVGIGHWQGQLRMDKGQALYYEALKRGYAVAFSSGTSTATHYNMQLAQETATMLKEHFAATYATPRFTIGIGGSGGAIQQYLLAQNSPGLLDGAITQLSYPDMVTQISYVADCDLLERYFDQQYQNAPGSKWGDWLFRAEIEGLSANTTANDSAKQKNPYAPHPGASTCSRHWRGHTQNIMNPHWTHPAYQQALELFRYPAAVQREVKWTYWNDLANIYPQDEAGFGLSTWDNTGVQYGLDALRRGLLTVDEFLQLNACIGGWKPANQMRLGDYPWNPDADSTKPDPWDAANMTLAPGCKHGAPAPRSRASDAAIAAAISSGQVFRGAIQIPVIDVRWYLDPALDIHHLRGSFDARARIQGAQGHHHNQIIWVAACDEIDAQTLERRCNYDPSADALDVMALWLTQGKPANAVDGCFDHRGKRIHAGADSWHGILDDHPAGVCTQRFPVHSTSRQAAGENMRGDSLKCRLKTVETALQDGSYAALSFSAQQQERLKQIFNDGVCANP